MRLLVSLFAVAVSIAGCGESGPEPPPTSAAPPALSPVASDITVTVHASKTHAVQPGDQITVSVEATGFALDAGKIGQATEAGVGHYRVYLDAAAGDDFLAESGDAETMVVVPETITDGTHELRVVLFNNDRTVVAGAPEAAVSLIVYRL